MLYYVKSFVKGIAKNGRPYYKLSLVGEDGNVVSATCFSTLEYDPGDYVGGIIVSDLSPSDQFPKVTDAELSTILPLRAPVPEAFKKFVNPTVTPEAFHQIVQMLLREAGEDESPIGVAILGDLPGLFDSYLKATAAHAMHHAFIGGLLLHTYEMLRLLHLFVKDRQGALPFKVNPLHCLIGVLYHDFGKLREYDGFDYTETIALTPHCILGAEEVEKCYSGYFEPRDIQLIKHIILSHHGKPEFGAACVPATLDAFLVHTIDMLSGQGYAMSHCANLERCGFTSSLVVVP